MSGLWQKLCGVIRRPATVGLRLLNSPFGGWLSDERYLRWLFRLAMGYRLNLANPGTFNEKLQWLKLYDRRDTYTEWVDKYRVRAYIAEKLGEEYLVPLLGVWDDPDAIDFGALPNRFVLKCTHNSGLGMCICKDKTALDIDAVKEGLRKGLRQDYFRGGREWPYKDVPHRIVAEAYLEDATGELRDYKLMCFGGKVEATFVCSDRFSEKGMHLTVMDRDWQVLPIKRKYPAVEDGAPCPATYDRMVAFAERLAKDLPFMRVDFYEVNGRLYFGEITFFPGSGLEKFYPEEGDRWFGDKLSLPTDRIGNKR